VALDWKVHLPALLLIRSIVLFGPFIRSRYDPLCNGSAQAPPKNTAITEIGNHCPHPCTTA
jgi:hypothetical protein